MKIAPTAGKVVYSGPHGNASCDTLHDTLSGALVDTETLLGTFPGGTTFDGVRFFNDALGAGTSIELGLRSVDDSTDMPGVLGTFDTATEGQKQQLLKPLYIKDNMKIIAKVKGGTASGEILATLDYRYTGIGDY
ncbi:hypothetical protein [Pseudoalteromonas rubra]|uniref:hypothetical protein n=1 Tax=Pseudoalteromonas rubra TaxID=43658 RepID=UPI002DBD7FA1|nr:hypothetical protein [Pseudoalteromonas rubra]MEC4091587.1 hypothetical protein [Pseudoalteromonas rubra]